MIPFARTQACFSLSFLLQTFVRAPSSEICVQRGSRSSIKASTVATAAALSRLSDLGDGPSFASRAIDCLRFGTSFARRRVSGVACAAAATSSNAPRMLAVPSLVQWFRSGSDGVRRACSCGLRRCLERLSPTETMNGRLFAAVTRPLSICLDKLASGRKTLASGVIDASPRTPFVQNEPAHRSSPQAVPLDSLANKERGSPSAPRVKAGQRVAVGRIGLCASRIAGAAYILLPPIASGRVLAASLG